MGAAAGYGRLHTKSFQELGSGEPSVLSLEPRPEPSRGAADATPGFQTGASAGVDVLVRVRRVRSLGCIPPDDAPRTRRPLEKRNVSAWTAISSPRAHQGRPRI